MSVLAELAKLYFGTRAVKSALEGLSNELAAEKPIAMVGAKQLGEMQMTVHQTRTLEDRMKYIRQMARKGMVDPQYRKWVASVLGRKCGKEWCIKERDWDGEVKALFNAFQKRVRYTRDIDGIDTYQSPRRTLEMGVADCDDGAISLASALKSAGYPVKFRVIRTKRAADWDHIYTVVGLPPGNPTRWVSLDASARKPAGWEAPRDQVAAVRDFDF